MKRVFLSMVVILFITVLVACGEDDSTEEEETDAVLPVEVVEAEKDDLVVKKKVYGRTAPIHTTPIMVANPGEIDTLEVENGDEVKKDDLIAKVKSPAGTNSIYAPKAGEVSSLKLQTGDITSDSEPLALIIDLDKSVIDFTVTGDLHGVFKIDDKIKAIINKEEYETEVTSIGSMPDDTGLYPIQVTTDEDDKEILPGTIAVIHVPVKRVKDAIVLPTEAIIEEADGSFVYLIEDDKAVKTEITIKEIQSDKTAIEGDVEKGDTVVINGQLTLTDGSKVEVVKEGNKS